MRTCGLILFVLLLMAPAAGAAVDTINNNFTMIDPGNNVFAGANDVRFTWDGTLKTSVAVSGQVSNASISSLCSFFGVPWTAHDVAVYGPGAYTVYAGCPAGGPGCGTGVPINFTVKTGEIGIHLLLDWNDSVDSDVVNVMKPNAAASNMWTGGCGSNSASTVWTWMSYDFDGDGVSSTPIVDGPFAGMNANFNLGAGAADLCYDAATRCNDGDACTIDSCDPLTGACIFKPIDCNDDNLCTADTCNPATGCEHTLIGNCIVDTINNNFTMNQPDAVAFGGTNDVRFTWDGTMKTSVAVSGQVSNATISSACPFFGVTWSAHDVAIYGPGAYTVYTGCPAGSPGCGSGVPYTFTVNPGEIGGHMLFLWNGNDDIDVVNVWKPGAFQPSDYWSGGCGSNPPDTIWDWMSYDWDGDGINGAGMVDGPFVGMNANFNLKGVPPPDPCADAATRCNDNNACTTDTCDQATGACINTPIVCDDNNACTVDTCDPAAGCVHVPIETDDHNACTTESCNPATGVVSTPIICNDGSACTADSCNPATGCVYTPINCDDNNACTSDSCDPATGCVHTPIVCDDNNACTTDTCDPATGCVYSAIPDCPACPAGSVKGVTIRGGGQKPSTVDLQIQTIFTVQNDGCIVDWSNSSVTVTPGTILQFDCKKGLGPQPTSGTWKGVPIPVDSDHLIVCPAASGEVGKLILDNKLGGGKDVDRMTISVQ